jgi:hypothetical protein
MAPPPEWAILAVKFGGSLIAIMTIVCLVRRLGLGTGYERIRDEIHAIAIAEEADCGFNGVAADVDAAGYGAIVRNGEGAMMLVRVHGNRFAARRIEAGFTARLDRNRLWLHSGDRAFGSVELDFGDRASVIASRLRTVR